MSKGLGELVVVALKARNLPNRAIIGKQDPSCRFTLGKHSEVTKIDYRGGQHPLWDDQVNLPVEPGITKLKLKLFDGEAQKGILISDGEVDISQVLSVGEQDDWFPLQYKGREAGEIYLELTFYASNKPRAAKKLPQEPPEPQQRRNKPLPRPPHEPSQLMYRHSINIPPSQQNPHMRPPPISTGGPSYGGPASGGYPPSIPAYPPTQQQRPHQQQYSHPSSMYPPVTSSNLPPAGFIDPSTRPLMSPSVGGNSSAYGSGFPTPVVTPRLPQQQPSYSAYPPVQQSPMYQPSMLQQPFEPQQPPQQQQPYPPQMYDTAGGYPPRPMRQNTMPMSDQSYGYPPTNTGYPPANNGYPPSTGYPPY